MNKTAEEIIKRVIVLENRILHLDRLRYIRDESWKKKKQWSRLWNKTNRKVRIYNQTIQL